VIGPAPRITLSPAQDDSDDSSRSPMERWRRAMLRRRSRPENRSPRLQPWGQQRSRDLWARLGRREKALSPAEAGSQIVRILNFPRL